MCSNREEKMIMTVKPYHNWVKVVSDKGETWLYWLSLIENLVGMNSSELVPLHHPLQTQENTVKREDKAPTEGDLCINVVHAPHRHQHSRLMSAVVTWGEWWHLARTRGRWNYMINMVKYCKNLIRHFQMLKIGQKSKSKRI